MGALFTFGLGLIFASGSDILGYSQIFLALVARSWVHRTAGCGGHRYRQDRHCAARGPARCREPAACAATWRGGPAEVAEAGLLRWVDGVGQADPGHFRLHGT